MYEYKVVPAPRRPRKFKGVKGVHQQYAAVVAEEMNELASGGWEYLRAETLPVDEKPGLLKSRVETYHSVMVYRRVLVEAEVEVEPEALLIEEHDVEEVIEEQYTEETYHEEAAEEDVYAQDPPLTRE